MTSAANALLNVNDLSIQYNIEGSPVPVVDRVSFVIEPGEILGLVGESGCGKSQLALALAGLSPKQAQITLDAPVTPRRPAMIFQDPLTSLNPVIKIGRQIEEAVQADGRKKRREKVLKLLNQVGIPDPEERIDQYPHQFSGGMQQRVLIAIALAQEPDMLIADEPTTALDVTIQEQILDLLKELNQATGLSILFITHDLILLREFANKIIVMYAGRIIETGTVEDIFSTSKHPYTKALMSVSSLNKSSEGNFEAIPGAVPSPQEYPTGCRFHPRCEFAVDSCSTTVPDFECENGHSWACPIV